MNRLMVAGVAVACVVCVGNRGAAQTPADRAGALAELVAQRERVASGDTRTRVEATHRVWSVALVSPDSDVKVQALSLLLEPVGSSSDHIRMPAVYAIAEIASSTSDPQVKIRAIAALAEPLKAGQVPIRDVAIDAVNAITRSGKTGGVALAAVRALAEPVDSGNNAVRIPAINALVRAVEGSQDPAAYQAALDLLVKVLDSSATIGGMEVRMMGIAAMEKIGLDVSDVAGKAKAMGILQAYASRNGWEPESRKRAQDGATRVQSTVR